MAKYLVSSPEGAAWAGPEVEEGDIIDRDLSAEEKLALIAAGWLSDPPAKKD